MAVNEQTGYEAPQRNAALQSNTAQAQEQVQKASVQAGSSLCRHCGAALDPGLPFCTECGEKIESTERVCEYCQTKTSKEICPQCGRRVVPIPCPKCSAPSIHDACESCGTILNSALEAALAQGSDAQKALGESAKMSEEEKAKIAAEFEALEKNESPEFKAFQKKLVERQILLEERDYSKKREKRIIKAFGSRPFTLELPDPEEESFRMKAYAALEKTVKERDEKIIEAELERLFPPLPAAKIIDETELKRLQAEMGKNLSEMAEQVRQDMLEAERQRQIEIARRKMIEELRKKFGSGVYYFGNPASDYEYIKIAISSGQVKCMHHCGGHGDSYGNFALTLESQNVMLQGTMSSKDCPLFHSHMHTFVGTLNDSGTVLTGHWGSESVTHYRT